MFEGLFQPMHLIVLLAIALVIFGPGKLPQIGEGLGKGIREFRKALSHQDREATGHTTGTETAGKGEQESPR
ncbi:MAG: twin-arginine translocase TatA/TatE family subunit [Nitrospirae bacterium]|nr:twin-arginine translocase TatA/TatE family subunit [Nitrospirota bacterium]